MVGGIETVGFCERELFAQRVLAKHWPDVPIHDDIKTLNPKNYETIDILTGGFPCQPYSVAGDMRGNEDERALWPEMLRVINEARPRWVLGENVVGLIDMGFDQICSDLEAAGYEVGAAIVPAHCKDAPHKRERVWIFGRRAGSEPCRWGAEDCFTASRGEIGDNGLFYNLPHTEGLPVEKCTEEQVPRVANLQVKFGRVGEAVGVRSELCDSLIAGVVDGVSAGMDRNRKARVKALGNAIVPQVAAEIIAAMKRVDNLANAERIHGDAGAGKPRETLPPLDGASC
jgi:DNA (cytosine-5)-methyltransferase 1